MPSIGPTRSPNYPPRTMPKPRGIDPDSEDMSKFLTACEKGGVWTVKNYLDTWPMHTEAHWTNSKMTGLLCAAKAGNWEIVTILVTRGARLQATDKDGVNALMLAADKGHENIVKYLLEKGLSARLKDSDSRTALHHYVCGGDTDRDSSIPALLAKHGAIIDDKSPSVSALEWAMTLGRKMMVRALLDIGADVTGALTSTQGATIDPEILRMVEDEPARRGQAAVDALNEGTGAPVKIKKLFNLSKTPEKKAEPKPAPAPAFSPMTARLRSWTG